MMQHTGSGATPAYLGPDGDAALGIGAVLPQRRRRRFMGGALAGAALALFVVASPRAASAQAGATLNRFSAAPTPEDDFTVSRPTDLGHLRFGAQLHVDYGLNPLVFERQLADGSTEDIPVVSDQLGANVGLSLGLFDRVVIFAGMPTTLVMEGAGRDAAAPLGAMAADGPGFGDAYLGARVRLFGEADDLGAIALQVTGTAPTAGVPNDALYRGERSFTVHPQLLGELRLGLGARVALNVGARIREESASADTNLAFGHELTYGLGFAMPVWSDDGDRRTHLDVTAQVYGASAFAMMDAVAGHALEATAGARFFHASGIVAGLAGGPGVIAGFGTPDLRAIAMIGWVTPTEAPLADADGDGVIEGDACPAEAEDRDGFEDADGCIDEDDDGDGVMDVVDACPRQAEVVDGIDDGDGCPDTIGDRDGDGVLDPSDACADEAEDADGFEDGDGCPDPDDDGDGVEDAADACRTEAGPAANRGCPDTDRDEDGVVDRLDNCPGEAGAASSQGCVAEQQVAIRDGLLEFLEPVHFGTGSDVIEARSLPLLRNVADVLRAHPEIERVVVEGHTDARGDAARNLELSQRRAEAVARFLVEQAGIDAGRLEARGFGAARPIVEGAATAEDRARNRRVELRME